MKQKYPKDELFEKLASIQHDIWANWQKYLHSKLKDIEYKKGDNTICSYLLDAGDYEHWNRQIDSDYSELSEKEKDSNREQVLRYYYIVKDFYEEKEKFIF